MLLLVVTNDTAVNETGITDVALNKELKSIVLGNFYLAREYTDVSTCFAFICLRQTNKHNTS